MLQSQAQSSSVPGINCCKMRTITNAHIQCIVCLVIIICIPLPVGKCQNNTNPKSSPEPVPAAHSKVSSSLSSEAAAARHGRPQVQAPAAAPAASAPVKQPKHTKPSPTPTPMPRNGSLDASQAKAVQALGFSLGPDPCNTDVQTLLICDTSSPNRHVISLQLQYCESNSSIPTSALSALAGSLNTLIFTDCPAKPPPTFSALKSLQTLTITRSLGKNPLHQQLSAIPANLLTNLPSSLTTLTIDSVAVNASLPRLLQSLPKIQSLTLSNTNVSGPIPATLPQTLTSLRLPENGLKSVIPKSMSNLTSLTFLDLSSNNIWGPIPRKVSQQLAYLDLSHNALNGTVPAAIAGIRALRYLDLSANRLQGVLPFSTGFVRHLNTFRVASNSRLCYNSSILSSDVSGGADECDSHGHPLPVSTGGDDDHAFAPSPAPTPAAYDEDEQVSESKKKQSGPKTVVVAVAIALASLVSVIVVAVFLSRCCSHKR